MCRALAIWVRCYVYPAYQSVADPNIRQKFETAWGVNLDDKPGLTITEIMDGPIRENQGNVYHRGKSPLSEPDANHTIEALRKLDFLVVQDIFMTETAKEADVVLPAVSFAEKDGTFTKYRTSCPEKCAKPSNPSGRASWTGG